MAYVDDLEAVLSALDRHPRVRRFRHGDLVIECGAPARDGGAGQEAAEGDDFLPESPAEWVRRQYNKPDGT